MAVGGYLQVVRSHLKSTLRMLLLTMSETFLGAQIFVRLLKAEIPSEMELEKTQISTLVFRLNRI